MIRDFRVFWIAQMKMMLPMAFPVSTSCLREKQPDGPIREQIIAFSISRKIIVGCLVTKREDGVEPKSYPKGKKYSGLKSKYIPENTSQVNVRCKSSDHRNHTKRYLAPSLPVIWDQCFPVVDPRADRRIYDFPKIRRARQVVLVLIRFVNALTEASDHHRASFLAFLRHNTTQSNSAQELVAERVVMVSVRAIRISMVAQAQVSSFGKST